RPAATVRGRVIRAGSPVALASVWSEGAALPPSPNESRAVQADSGGSYQLSVPDGVIRLAARAPGEGRVEGPTLAVALGETREGNRAERPLRVEKGRGALGDRAPFGPRPFWGSRPGGGGNSRQVAFQRLGGSPIRRRGDRWAGTVSLRGSSRRAPLGGRLGRS